MLPIYNQNVSSYFKKKLPLHIYVTRDIVNRFEKTISVDYDLVTPSDHFSLKIIVK